MATAEASTGHDCPTCGESFDTENGMKVHHAQAHGESIAGVAVDCDNCGETIRQERTLAEEQDHHFCDKDCFDTFQRKSLPREKIANWYETKGLSPAEIAERVDASRKTVQHRINEWDLEPPEATKPYQSEEWLRKEYLQKEKTTVEIAEDCSVSARTISEYLNRFGINAQKIGMKRTRKRVTVKCAFCGESLIRRPAHTGKTDRFFCDNTCQGNWLAENKVGESHPDYQKVEVNCEWCGSPVYLQPYRMEKSQNHFCDYDCLGNWRSENQSGENHPRWKGGVFPYGKGWNEQKREKVRERDNRQCQTCGMSESEHLDEFGRRLDVHHIQPAREFDDPEARNSLENLVSLCVLCHRKAEQTAPLLPAGLID